MHSDCGDIVGFVCIVILQDRVIEGSCEFMGRSLLRGATYQVWQP